jgi:hypothetical protein
MSTPIGPTLGGVKFRPAGKGPLGRRFAGSVVGRLKVVGRVKLGRVKLGVAPAEGIGGPAANAPVTGVATARAPIAEAIAVRRLGVEIMR